MLLSAAITLVLTRTGKTISETDSRDQARQYLSLATTEFIQPTLAMWWFLDKTTTFTTVASTRTYQPVSAQVSQWYSFVDQTNNYGLPIVGPDQYDANDFDLTETGTAEIVYISGMDATTGYPVIEIGPTPGTTGDVIRVRYRIDIPEWAASDDATELTVLGLIPIAQNCIVYNASSMYLEDEGDTQSAAREAARYGDCLTLAVGQNRRMQGNRRFPPRRGQQDQPLIRVDSGLIVPP
jgi:hypothetical protein|tara:strand:- start:65 stop:778 length:714 start_codon:yes stop_codon:yes gene_type:complete